MKVRRWLQFSLGTLLFLVFCVSGFLAGHLAGERHWEDGNCKPRSYRFLDLLPNNNSIEYTSELLALVDKLGITPSGYASSPSEPGSFRIVGGKQDLLEIMETPKRHKEIEAVLERLRETKKRMDAEGDAFRVSEFIQ